MNSTNGQISLTRDLDSSDINDIYTFSIVATDPGLLSGSAAIQVRVVNVSEVPFYITYGYYEVMENQRGEVIDFIIEPEGGAGTALVVQVPFEGFTVAGEVSKMMLLDFLPVVVYHQPKRVLFV